MMHNGSTEELLLHGSAPTGSAPKPTCPLSSASSVDALDTLTINVGGARFVTTHRTLQRIPDTRLARIACSDNNYNSSACEWFFDRNPALFNYILDYYRSSELHFPHNFCGPSIKKELNFWHIEEHKIAPCCWNRYREYEEEKKIYERIEDAFQSNTKADATFHELTDPTAWQTWRRHIWLFLEEPMSSLWAQVWTVFFLSIVLGSICILCIETLPSLRIPRDDVFPMSKVELGATELSGGSSSWQNTSYQNVKHSNFSNPKIIMHMNTQPHAVLNGIDNFCTCFFTIEFIVRFMVSPSKIKFCKNFMNIIDVLCVLPMWIKYIMQLYRVTLNFDLLPVFFLLMMLRVLRICRVLRLARHYTGVKILVLALTASMQELGMLLIFVFIVVLIFAVAIYYAEFFVDDTFDTIPHGYWWAIITLTTVGYGDMYPKSILGYVIGALCALTGILATGLPVPIIANNFNLYYSHAQMKDAVLNRKRSVISAARNYDDPQNIPSSPTKVQQANANVIKDQDV